MVICIESLNVKLLEYLKGAAFCDINLTGISVHVISKWMQGKSVREEF